MIIESLAKYYDALVENDGEGRIPRRGWGTAKVIGTICLNEEGEITDIISIKEMDGKKMVPIQMIVPEQGIRSSGIKPNFLCDGPEYLLGVNTKGRDPIERFLAAKEYHLAILNKLDETSIVVNGLVNFWQKYNPTSENENISLRMDLLTENGNFIFSVNGVNAHTDSAVKELWQNYSDSHSDAPIMQCSITGKEEPIARLHPNIKGVRGAQSSGGALVSFNAQAFSSYGKEQSYNAPVSELVTFKYTTALNYLLNESSGIYLGDTTVVSWAIDGNKGCKDLFEQLFSTDEKMNLNQDNLRQVLSLIAKGKKVSLDDYEIDPNTEFCILGLSPNVARLSVRFFWKDRFGKMIQSVMNHYQRLEIQKPNYEKREYLSVGNLLYETVNKNSKDKSASPILVGGLMKAVLNDTYYPQSLDTAVVMRIRAERGITWGQAAILKAVLLKNRSNDSRIKEVCTVGLNSESDYEPYVLGQLFSVLEEIQEKANENIKSTIKDKYFTSAASMPAMIFPRLMQLSQAHIRKIPDDEQGKMNKIRFNKKLTELYSKLPEKLSPKLSLIEQESFFIGYYHQNEKRYEKKNKEEQK